MKMMLRICAYIVIVPAIVLGIVAAAAWLTSDAEEEPSLEQIAQYRELAKSIGLDYDREYRYRDLVETNRANSNGIAGQYELLYCDGGERSAETDFCTGFSEYETVYYKNHDVTVTYKYRVENEASFVRLRKIGKGRLQDLHLR